MSTDESPHELDDSKMSFLSHLRELRQRIFYTLAGLLLGTLICFSWAPEMFELLRQPLAEIQDQQMIVIGPLEMFITYLKLAVLAGLFLTSPWILAQIWFFIAPGLYTHEKKWLAPFIILGSLFFIAGGYFAYAIVLPMGFEYLVQMVPDSVAAQFSVAVYFALVVRLILAFGIVFELPLVMWILSAAGIIHPDTYSSIRKYWLVISVALAAFLTPPDPFTQLMMAIPLVLFFEAGILGARILYKDSKTAEEENEEESTALNES